MVGEARALDARPAQSARRAFAGRLFHIVQADRLRVYTRVPQTDASRITPQVHAEVVFTDHPGHPYPAKFLKTAEAIDQASRTMLVEFMIDNKDNGLLAGGYGEIHIALPGVASSLRLPVNTLIFRADGLQVATVDADNKTSLHTVVMGRDFGNEVEIASGIGAQDRVIVNPPDSLIGGQPVRIAEPKKDDKTDSAKETPAK